MKLKSNVKKKLLTALLIGASISGISGKASFASSNNNATDMSRSQFVSISSPEVKRIIDDMNTNRWTVVIYPITGTPYTYVLGGQKLYLYDSSNGGGFRKGLTNVNGHKCFFNERHFYGERGWYNVPGYGRCYFDPARYEARSFCFDTINGETFHFDYDGTVDMGIFTVGGKTYCGDKRTGALKTGWWSEGGHRYFFDSSLPNGAAHQGWYRDGSAGYMCFDSHGYMLEGLQFLDDGIFLFQHHGKGANSYTTPGFYSTNNGARYYFNPDYGNRALQDTWLNTGYAYYKNGNGKMYFGKDGRMANGVTDINGEKYLFLQPSTFTSDRLNAYQCTGWYTEPFTHNRYYFNPGNNGQASRSVSNTPEGAAVKGVQYIDGQRYVFDNNGVLIG